MADVEDNSPLGVMNRIRKGFRAKARRLARKIPRQNIQNLEDNEESYKELEADVQTFHRNLDRWEEELPHNGDPVEEEDEDEEVDRGDPIYPEVGAGAGYIPERVTVILDNFQEEINKGCVEFVRFKKAQGRVKQLAIAH